MANTDTLALDLESSISIRIENSFHDDCIYAFKLVPAEPETDDWRSELVLDVDHILEWVKTDNEQFQFLLVQADLCFENVTNLKVSFSCPDATINPLPIDRIERSDQPVVQRGDDYVLYQWAVFLNDRGSGKLEFQSTGYRLEQKADPQLFDQQTIPLHLRT